MFTVSTPRTFQGRSDTSGQTLPTYRGARSVRFGGPSRTLASVTFFPLGSGRLLDLVVV
jgi:hypothetical protein